MRKSILKVMSYGLGVMGFLLLTHFSLLITPAYAACPDPTDWRCVLGNTSAPINFAGNTADDQISNFISTIMTVIFAVAAIVFVFLIVFGAFGWMTSGGEKEALAKARARIVHAIIGLVILSLAFVIVNVIAHITNIGVLNPLAPIRPAFQNNPPGPPGTGSCSGDRTWNPATRRCE